MSFWVRVSWFCVVLSRFGKYTLLFQIICIMVNEELSMMADAVPVAFG